ncbi:NAD(P)H dehydrogenase (quinone) [Microbacterium halimionae]|uniref:NAD(P)H dehydrogenase (Quinone) n=2 Tax=Microbacterium halimionae TaxID=1526413 RepID=A0A7W3PMI9_9MICO|nr:SDR family oxidoreductase [Microbacterium halimionae]MBA8817121.1 NAD(P)H dehydrogenase (quinone) [Microbacterium halimionae]NII94338.1 NAD(P)H dehydrogenase (quinone) [Microbacterium halimionae]
MTILVTGASGQLGHLVVDSLLARGANAAEIVAGARTVEKADDIAAQGVRVVALDYTDSASLVAAFDGVDKVVLVSSSAVGQRVAQHQAVIDAAVAAGVSLFVYTSLLGAPDSPLPLAPEHVETEKAIAASGLPAVILRNSWYTENYAADLERARETGTLIASAGDGRVSSATRAEYADAAAAVVLGDGHVGAIYELGGDVAWSYAELAQAMSEITGREVVYSAISTADHVAALEAAGLDEGTAGFVAALDAGIAAGALVAPDHTLSELIGRPTASLVESLRA